MFRRFPNLDINPPPPHHSQLNLTGKKNQTFKIVVQAFFAFVFMMAGVLLFFGLKRLSDFGFDANLLDGNDISHKCYIWSFALYRSLTKWTPTWNISPRTYFSVPLLSVGFLLPPNEWTNFEYEKMRVQDQQEWLSEAVGRVRVGKYVFYLFSNNSCTVQYWSLQTQVQHWCPWLSRSRSEVRVVVCTTLLLDWYDCDVTNPVLKEQSARLLLIIVIVLVAQSCRNSYSVLCSHTHNNILISNVEWFFMEIIFSMIRWYEVVTTFIKKDIF